MTEKNLKDQIEEMKGKNWYFKGRGNGRVELIKHGEGCEKKKE